MIGFVMLSAPGLNEGIRNPDATPFPSATPISNDKQVRHAIVYPEFGHEIPLVILYDTPYLEQLHAGNTEVIKSI